MEVFGTTAGVNENSSQGYQRGGGGKEQQSVAGTGGMSTYQVEQFTEKAVKGARIMLFACCFSTLVIFIR